jgi:Ca2+-binding RTX toxin-like protein
LPAGARDLTLTGSDDIDAVGNTFSNRITGNSGDNVLGYTGGLDVLDGAAGTDTADFSRFNFAVWVDLAYAAGPHEAWTLNSTNASSGTWQRIADLMSIENLTGTPFDDLLAGNAAANRLDGGAGDDKLFAAGGDDTLLGGAGNDSLFYESGLVVFDGGGGTDTADFYLFNHAAWVDLAYAAGPYEAWTLNSSNTVSGTWQRIADLRGIENLTGTRFDDLLSGDAGVNRLDGGAGHDRLYGGGGNDTLLGGDGTDTLTYQSGLVTFDGGADTDTADFFQFVWAVWVDLTTAGTFEAWTLNSTNAVSGSWQRIADLTRIENLVGTRFDDLLQGDGGANRLDGGAGHDRLYGQGGNDTFVGGAGNDLLVGGPGADRFDFNAIAHGLDTIADFTAGPGGDIIDVRDVLAGFVQGTSNAASFVQLVGSAGGTTLRVNADGAGSDFVDLALLQGTTGVLLDDLLANGNLALV